MRVVAGSLRGRRLLAPPGPATRPTSDRVREATFNALASLDLLRDAAVVDLFAGSGALGIEALSRGAARCIFVEEARPALAALARNLADLGLVERATVVPSDVSRYLAMGAATVDLALADPPYAFEAWEHLVTGAGSHFVVAESDRAVEAPPGWEVVRTRRYGRTHVSFLRHCHGPPSPAG